MICGIVLIKFFMTQPPNNIYGIQTHGRMYWWHTHVWDEQGVYRGVWGHADVWRSVQIYWA